MTSIPSAKELMASIAKVEGEKASTAMTQGPVTQAAEAEKQALLDRLAWPSACRTTRSCKRRQ